MKYLVFAEEIPRSRIPYEASSPKAAVRQWADNQSAATWDDEYIWVVVIDSEGVESRWSVRTEFDFHITERT